MDGQVDIDDIVDHRDMHVPKPLGRGRPPKPKREYRIRFRHHTDPKEDRWFTREELMETAPQVVADYERKLKREGTCEAADELRLAIGRLEEKVRQLRAVQKRLLLRFTDQSPTHLQHLNILFQEAYSQVSKAGDDVADAQKILQDASNNLSCGTHLLLFLIRHRFGLDEDSFDALEGYLSPLVDECSDQSWEERTLFTLTYLLNGTSMTAVREELQWDPSTLELNRDSPEVSKLKMLIRGLCEQIHFKTPKLGASHLSDSSDHLRVAQGSKGHSILDVEKEPQQAVQQLLVMPADRSGSKPQTNPALDTKTAMIERGTDDDADFAIEDYG
ncbi:hypothetical protein CBR_g5607 [Chara braunii]|uniref:PTHB1 hairpin domain-containing protein n=1 Tax=Chara braunii TaxID=69332 RepID=A0A388JRK7_CHABU|nr:hypothetical protein CBR_g5607 [Chara braunii]|eukprot:GBG60431.1 hypothetical protein CBR_g5607 [Chara braunii]